jgi:hypothetical protein
MKLEQRWSHAPKLKVSIDELQLESTFFFKKKKTVENQEIVTVDAGTDSAHGKVIRCNFKPGSEERSIDQLIILRQLSMSSSFYD